MQPVVDPVEAEGTAAFDPEHIAFTQDFQVIGEVREPQIQDGGQIAHAERAGQQQCHDPPASGVGEGTQGTEVGLQRHGAWPARGVKRPCLQGTSANAEMPERVDKVVQCPGDSAAWGVHSPTSKPPRSGGKMELARVRFSVLFPLRFPPLVSQRLSLSGIPMHCNSMLCKHALVAIRARRGAKKWETQKVRLHGICLVVCQPKDRLDLRNRFPWRFKVPVVRSRKFTL